MQKNKSGSKVAVEVGAGLALAAAAAAGAMFLYGKQGAKNRKKIKSWTLKAKAEVLEKMERLKEIDQTVYNKAIEEVTKRYQALKHVDKKELEQMAKELRGHWKSISGQISGGGKKKTSGRKKVPKK